MIYCAKYNVPQHTWNFHEYSETLHNKYGGKLSEPTRAIPLYEIYAESKVSREDAANKVKYFIFCLIKDLE